MERRTFIQLIAVAPMLGSLASCGDDDAAAPGAPLPSVGEPAPTATDAPDVPPLALEFGYYGGFTTREIGFQMRPSLLVTADRQVIRPGASPAIYPGALLPPYTVQTITPQGVDALIAATDLAGMFAEVDYETNPSIADAATATLIVVFDGVTYRHAAYALGAGGLPGDDVESSPERQAFAAFVAELESLPGLVGPENLGPEQIYEPDAYQLIAFPAGDLSGLELEPTLVEWPASTGVVLAELTECTEVSRDLVGDLFAEANQLTFFTEGGETYSVVPRPAFQGRECP